MEELDEDQIKCCTPFVGLRIKHRSSYDLYQGEIRMYTLETGLHLLPLAALPLCRVIIACCFRVAALSGNAALALSPSGIAPELNRIQLSAICRGGQSGKVIDLLV